MKSLASCVFLLTSPPLRGIMEQTPYESIRSSVSRCSGKGNGLVKAFTRGRQALFPKKNGFRLLTIARPWVYSDGVESMKVASMRTFVASGGVSSFFDNSGSTF